jgi:hypothetical protein
MGGGPGLTLGRKRENIAMRFFVSDRHHAKGDEPHLHGTNSYLEIEVPVDENNSLYTYIIPRGEHSAFVAICLNDMFDKLVDELDDDTYETVAETWPTLATLLHNGIKDKYKNGALIRLEDSDYGDTKWFVASVAGNISFDSEEALFCDRTNDAISVVLEKANQLLTELNENEPSTLKAIGKGLVQGLTLGLFATAAQALGIDIKE